MVRKTQATTKARGKKKQKVSSTPRRSACALARLCYVLELGTVPAWEYLSPAEISATLSACIGAFSPDFADAVVALKAIDKFAVENKTHLGRHCGCDWLRSLEFVCRSNDVCADDTVFSVDRTLPIFELAGGAQALLDGLVITRKLMQPFSSTKRFQDATFVPIVCPLATNENPVLETKAAITRAMNDVFPKAGTRYFYKFKLDDKSSGMIDYLEQHWGGIDGSTCQYCDRLAFGNWNSREIKGIRLNCATLYRPLKAAMEANLRHVKFIRRRHWSRQQGIRVHFMEYQGLVAGITNGGVLCGLYLKSGYVPPR